jgi:hypothetical protein
MPIGAGGLISDLWFPGLDDKMARHITPNPSPLAQQGGPPQPGQVDSLGNPSPPQPPPGANLPPSASTQPDPVVAANTAKLLDSSYAGDALKYIRRDEMGRGLNLGLDRIAAGFGTAQQQASKQQAIAREQGVGGGLGDLAGIQKMQDQTIADNERARFFGNAQVFADTLTKTLGRPVSLEEAQMFQNNPQMLQGVATASSHNMDIPDDIRKADAATEAYKIANPGASAQDVAQFRANLLSNAAMGGDSKAREYMQAKQAWLNDPANKGKPLPPELATQAAFEEDKAGGLVETKAKAKDLAADQHNFAPALTNYEKTIDALNEFLTPEMQKAAQRFLGQTGQYVPEGMMSDPEKKAYKLYKQIMASQFAAGVQDFKGAGRITQMELQQDLPSQSTMGLNQAPGDFQDAVTKYREQLMRKRAGLFGAAQKTDDPRLSDEDYAKYVAPNIDLYGGKRRANDFTAMSEAEIDAAVDRLPSGARFIGPDGQVHAKK